ncbi:MAG TPA: TIGR04372 family glycosyltransferase, partial [Candidatus Babeliales bacterium]|nr:TIGR04372 family glycosyltransferase [Candidatus Babeliales bacterium]
SLFPGREKHTVKIPLIDSHGIVPEWPPHIYFTHHEEEFGMKKLREMGVPINAPFICFHNRDAAYEKRFVRKEEDPNFHEYRDSNINNYIFAVTRLTKKGYYAFRMGTVVNEQLNLTNSYIIDYATDYRSDFMDIYLSSKCKFFIASNTGITGLPILFRNNMVLVNYIPFQLINIPAWPRNSLLILKKLWLKTEKRFLTFKEMSSIEVDIHYKGNYYESINIEPIENTSEEILDVVTEMDDRLNGTWQTQKEDEELQDIFWSFFPSIAKKSEKKNKYSFRIGAEFLRKNKDLLKC